MQSVPVGSIRWTAREEPLCCSFLQKQMQTSPNDKKDQLLRATSVYLVTKDFRNTKRIYTHLWERAYRDVNAASNVLHSWHQYRTHAHYVARFGTYAATMVMPRRSTWRCLAYTRLPV